MTESATVKTQARNIAKRCLVSNITTVKDPSDPKVEKRYLLAGAYQYRTLWARDFCMSVQGALAVGEVQAVHDSLELFFSFQRSDGLLPRQIDNRNIFTRVAFGVLGAPPSFKPPLKPWFTTENQVISIDGNLLLPIAANLYINKTGDLPFAQRWFATAQLALSFLEEFYLDAGLIGNQPPYSDWADSIRRTGRVAFTNALYILALQSMANWAKMLQLPQVEADYRKRSIALKTHFFQHFWNSEKGILLNFDGNEHLSADANLCAVIYRLVPNEARFQIMNHLRNSPLWDPIPGRPTWPDYPSSLKSKLVKLVGVGGYHDSLYWLWINAMAARAEYSVGNMEGYRQIMLHLSERIAEDNTVHEVYELSPKHVLVPFKRLFYRAEPHFTWSSAMFLEADAIEREMPGIQKAS